MTRPSLELLVPGWTDIRTHRPLLTPLLLGWLLSALSAWSIHPFLLLALPPGSESMRSLIVTGLAVVAGLAPLFALLRAGGLALMTWASATLLGSHRDLRELLSIYLYGDCLRGLLATLLVLWFHGVVVVTGTTPALVDPLSLAAFVPSDHGGIGVLASMISVTAAVWVVYTFVALRRVSGLGPRTATGLTILSALGALALTYLRASLGASG